MTTYKAVNWYDEELSQFYGDDNDGYIFGVYCYEDEEDFPVDVQWFNNEDQRNKLLEMLI